MDDLEKQKIFLGIVGIIDPPRDEAIEAIKECKSAGVEVKMITGDHAITARAIGKEIGIGDGEKLRRGARYTTIFARRCSLFCQQMVRRL